LQQADTLFQTPQLVLSQIIAALGGGTIAAVRGIAWIAMPAGGLRAAARLLRSCTPLLRLRCIGVVRVKRALGEIGEAPLLVARALGRQQKLRR
jgi:hypothetical protein